MTLEEILNLQDKYYGFRLLQLEVFDNDLFGTISYDFNDNGDDSNEIYTTVIIGPNGTRKSLLFRVVIELFRFLQDRKDGKDNINTRLQGGGGFRLSYSLNGYIYLFSNIISTDYLNIKRTDAGRVKTTNSYISINGEVKDFSKAELPLAILASSVMISDKYPYVSNNDFRQYRYLGVRNTPQTSSTGYQIRKTVDYIVNAVQSESFINSINTIINDFLEINHSPFVVYRTKNTPKFFWGELDVKKFDQYFLEIENKYKDKESDPPFKLNYYNRNLRENDTEKMEIVRFCNRLHDQGQLIDIRKSQTKILRYDISDSLDIAKLKIDYKVIDQLRSLGMLTTPEIDFVHKEKNEEGMEELSSKQYHVSESSSGEFNLLTSLIAIMANIKTHSLVFIDEPEVSLHPNWQMKYIHFLRNLFSSEAYSTCHIVIATHSHFLISDLPAKSSKIIGLTKESGVLKTVSGFEGLSTFGWSAEQVLLDIFNVPTTRNFYVAERFAQIIKKATLKGIDSIESHKKELLDWKNGMSEEDPLRYAIVKLIEKVGWQG